MSFSERNGYISVNKTLNMPGESWNMVLKITGLIILLVTMSTGRASAEARLLPLSLIEPVYMDNIQSKPRHYPVCVKYISEQREEEPIGYVQNGYGSNICDIYAASSISEWVAREMERVLHAAGFRADFYCQDPGDSALVIEMEISKVYITSFKNYLSEVTLHVEALFGTQKVKEKRYTGLAQNKVGLWGTSDENYNKTLNQALQNACLKMVFDLMHIDAAGPKELEQAKEAAKNAGEPDYGKMQCPERHRQSITLKGPERPEIDGILFGIDKRLQALYRDRIELNPEFEGAMCFYMKIGSNGKIEKLKMLRDTLGDPGMKDYLSSMLRQVAFQETPGVTESTEVTCRLDYLLNKGRLNKQCLVSLTGVFVVLPLALLLCPVIISHQWTRMVSNESMIRELW